MIIHSRSGSSLIEVLMASAIVIAMALTFASLMTSLFREFKAMAQKSDAAELRNSIILAFANANVCSWQLKDRVIQTAGVTTTTASPTDLEFPVLYAGMNSSSLVLARANTKISVSQSTLKVDSIHMKDIYSTGNPDEYVGTMHVNFSGETLIRAIKPVTTQVFFTVDPYAPATTKSIVDCTSAGAKHFTVAGVDLRKFHTGILPDCSNMNTGKMFWDAACFRFCTIGCAPGGSEQDCSAPIPGKGYPGGVAVECSGVDNAAECLCLR